MRTHLSGSPLLPALARITPNAVMNDLSVSSGGALDGVDQVTFTHQFRPSLERAGGGCCLNLEEAIRGPDCGRFLNPKENSSGSRRSTNAIDHGPNGFLCSDRDPFLGRGTGRRIRIAGERL